jgi:hypothetical protein
MVSAARQSAVSLLPQRPVWPLQIRRSRAPKRRQGRTLLRRIRPSFSPRVRRHLRLRRLSPELQVDARDLLSIPTILDWSSPRIVTILGLDPPRFRPSRSTLEQLCPRPPRPRTRFLFLRNLPLRRIPRERFPPGPLVIAGEGASLLEAISDLATQSQC